jgi:hypothetical protein
MHGGAPFFTGSGISYQRHWGLSDKDTGRGSFGEPGRSLLTRWWSSGGFTSARQWRQIEGKLAAGFGAQKVSLGLDFYRGWARHEAQGVLNPIPTHFDSLNRRFVLDSKGNKYPDSVKIEDKSSGFDSLLRFHMHEMESKAAMRRCVWGGGGSGAAAVARQPG